MTKCCSHETLLHFGVQGVFLEYLLLPPRSVLDAATLPVTQRAASRPPHTPTRCDFWCGPPAGPLVPLARARTGGWTSRHNGRV